MGYRSFPLCLALLFLVFYASPVAAFGAGNIGQQQICQRPEIYVADTTLSFNIEDRRA